MRRLSFLIFSTLLLATPARADVLSWQRVGPVQLGMSVKGAESALGTKLEPRSIVYTSDACYQTSRADKKDTGITYVVEDGKITVINVFTSDGRTPDVVDQHRLGIGAAEDGIRRAYGRINRRLGFYDRGKPPENDSEYVPEFWIEAGSPDNKRAILFITRAGKITSMTTGFKPMVLAPERCL
jgi:hypothetical protein